MTQALATLETSIIFAAVSVMAALLILGAVGWRVVRWGMAYPMQAEAGK